MMTPSKDPILKLSIINSIAKMLITALSFFLAVHFVNIKFTGYQIGLIFAANTLTSILITLPSGLSNDRFRSKYLIGFSLILLAIQYAGLYITHQFAIIIILFVIGGIGSRLYTISSDSLFFKSTNNEKVPKKIGIFQGINYFMIGIGMITAGLLREINIPFEKIFLITAIAFIIIAIISQASLPTSQTIKFPLIHYKKDIFRPKVLSFLLVLFLFAFHFGAESTTYGLFLKETLKLSPLQMGVYMGTAIITMALSSFLLSKKLYKFKPKNVLLFGLFVSGSGHILMTIEPAFLSAIFRIYHETGDAAMFFFLYYGITKLFDLNRIGGNASVFTLVSTIGGALGALLFGPLGDLKGYNTPLVISGIITLVGFLIAIRHLHHFEHE